MDWSRCPAVDRLPGKMGGAWCFVNTRMPVASLFDHLNKGATIYEFLEWFPDMEPVDVHAVLQFAQESLRVPEKAA